MSRRKRQAVMDLKRNRQLVQPSFIGYQGVGARIEIRKKRHSLIVRETTKSQLSKIILIGVIGFYPMYLMIYEYDKVNKKIGEIFVNVIMWGTGIIGVYFFYKFLVQFFKNRRIEINLPNKNIVFFDSSKEILRRIGKNEVKEFSIKESDFYSDGVKTVNYSLEIELYSSEIVILCITDSKDNAEKVFLEIKESLM